MLLIQIICIIVYKSWQCNTSSESSATRKCGKINYFLCCCSFPKSKTFGRSTLLKRLFDSIEQIFELLFFTQYDLTDYFPVRLIY